VTESAKPRVSKGEFQELEELLAEYEHIFAMGSEGHGRTNKVYHRIDTGDAQPISQPPRSLVLAKQAEVSEMLDDMQRRGFFEESDRPWSAPVVVVRKKDGELRFCVDYRKLDGVTKKGCFPLPRIEDTSEARWFSTVDLRWGFGK
jgi:hypothetical protein